MWYVVTTSGHLVNLSGEQETHKSSRGFKLKTCKVGRCNVMPTSNWIKGSCPVLVVKVAFEALCKTQAFILSNSKRREMQPHLLLDGRRRSVINIARLIVCHDVLLLIKDWGHQCYMKYSLRCTGLYIITAISSFVSFLMPWL